MHSLLKSTVYYTAVQVDKGTLFCCAKVRRILKYFISAHTGIVLLRSKEGSGEGRVLCSVQCTNIT